MKKIAFLSILTGLFMVGCTEMAQPADPQQNAQEELVTITGAVTATAVPTIDLAKVEGDSVKVANVATEITAPEGTELKCYLTLNETVEYEVPADTAIVLPVAELQAVVEEIHGKRPVERKIPAVVTVAAVVRGSAVLYKSEKFDLVVIPSAPFISSAYYLIGGMNDWDPEKAKDFKFSHSGKDVYEDPVFTITFTAGDECWWKIVPQSNYDAGDAWAKGSTGVVGVAVNGDEALEGKLSTSDDEIGAGVIKAGAGMYMMTINMMDYTYNIKALAPEYYILGDAPFAWNVNEKKFLMYAESSTVQSYTTKFEGNIKMINSNDMGTDNWAACYGTPVDQSTEASGTLVQNGGSIHVPETGYYTLKVDFKEMTYTWTEVEEPATEYKSIGIVGSFNGWNQKSDDMQFTQVAPHNWAKYGVVIGEEGNTYEIKINADKDWTVSWGGAGSFDDNPYGVLPGSDNCSISAGTYDIFFNDITLQYSFVKK